MKKLKMRWTVVAAVMGLFALAGCVTEPITGRRQLSLVAPAQEMQLGLSSFEQLKKETPISRDAAANALVQKVGRRIAAVAYLPNAQWEFVVFDSPEANAFCLPGGKVGVYRGILPVTKDEEGLATVIGHEVAHAAAHHGAERMSDAMALQAGGQALGLSLSKADARTQALVQMAYGVGAQVGVMLPFSRTQESAADRIGLTYMAGAGYNPDAAVAFWERFAEYGRRRGGAGLPGFLRTHPVDAVRIQQIKTWLPEARQAYRPR